MYLQFRTPGLIPLDAFTQFAVHHKPNTDSPIGHFGTGLKYALAIILRHGGTFKMWRDAVEYEFYTHKTDFRGKEIHTIRMRKRRGLDKWFSSTKLPFTVDLGKNWGLWQAYRELLSNTIDEGGNVYVGAKSSEWYERRGCTVIAIQCNELTENVIKDVYLPFEDIGEPDFLTDGMNVWRRPSKYLYYKGIRVFELPLTAWFTYDLSEGVTLSEDRSLMNQYGVFGKISRVLDMMDVDALMDPFTSDERWWETHDLSFFDQIDTHGSLRKVAAVVGSSGGYYLRALYESTNPSLPATYNIDIDVTADDIYEFVDGALSGEPGGDIWDAICSIVNRNYELHNYLIEKAAEHELDIPIELQH